jgi:plasmid maintenance system antidote protein VapI
MPRRARSFAAPTALSSALLARRGSSDQRAAAAEIGIPPTTLSPIERGRQKLSTETALKLARWLGWTMEQVVEAAGQPAPEGAGG